MLANVWQNGGTECPANVDSAIESHLGLGIGLGLDNINHEIEYNYIYRISVLSSKLHLIFKKQP